MDKLRNCIKEAISKLDKNEIINDKLLEKISEYVKEITMEHDIKYPEDTYNLKEHFEYLYGTSF